MRQKANRVKARRTYDASGRQERARQQHAATLEAASARFLEAGYTATTVESIAEVAGVSAATIYKSYGGKAGIVRTLCQRALEGVGPVPAEQRSNALRSGSDARDVIEGWGRLRAEVSPRISPLLLLLRDAARADVEAAALSEELDQHRLARMGNNARYLAKAGHLRAGCTRREARDVLWLSSAPELFELLVIRRGWSVTRYSRFATDMIINALL
jgi:AcrR family transcriptional regulator